MGTTNCGVFLIGNGIDSFRFENLPEWKEFLAYFDDEESWTEFDIEDMYESWQKDLPDLDLDWRFGSPSGYVSTNLVGFYLKSRSYDFDRYGLGFATDLFVIIDWYNSNNITRPEVYVGNLQG